MNLDTKLEVSLILKPGQPLPSVKEVIRRGRAFPIEKFDAKFQSNKESVRIVKEYVISQGFEVLEVNPEQWKIGMKGSVRDLNKIFCTTLQIHRLAGITHEVIGYQGLLSLPRELAPFLVGVLGLSSAPLRKSMAIKIKKNGIDTKPPAEFSSIACLASCGLEFELTFLLLSGALMLLEGVDITEYVTLYDFPDGLTGKDQTCGIVEFGGGFCPSDINQYASEIGLGFDPDIVAVPIGEGQNQPCGLPSADPFNSVVEFLEVTFDIEILVAVVPDAHIPVFFGANNSRGLYEVFSAIPYYSSRPGTVTCSWSFIEGYDISNMAAKIVNAAIQKNIMVGTSIFASSGDAGSTNGLDKLSVSFPASSPFVVGCGGTTTHTKQATISKEVVWNNANICIPTATGGGFSNIFPIPPYQEKFLRPQGQMGGGRGVPDVSANADLFSTGYSFLAGGQKLVSGGTSAVAPLWSGLITRIIEQLEIPLFMLPALLYELADLPFSDSFNQILEGNNIVFGASAMTTQYAASPGWNPCCGLGTPNGTSLLNAFYTNKNLADELVD